MNLREYKKYKTIYNKGIKTALGIDMAYKANFYVSIIQLLISLSASFIFIEVLYLQVNQINGWGKYDLWLLFGVFNLSVNLYSCFFYDIDKIAGKIKDGDLDSYLVKPLPTLYTLIIINPFLFNIPDIILNIAIVVFAIYMGAQLNLYLMVVTLILSIILYYSIHLFFQTLNFYTFFPQTAGNLAREIIDFGKTPANFYNFGIRLFLSFIFPLFLISGVMFGIQKNDLPTALILNVSIVVLTTLYLSLKFWKHGLKKYSSASS